MEDILSQVIYNVRMVYYGFDRPLEIYLIKFRNLLQKLDINSRRVFCDLHFDELKMIQKILDEIKYDKSYVDTVFRGLLEIHKIKIQGVSDIFADFIKGITYFAGEESNNYPIYHRLSSCGPKLNNDGFRKNNLVCNTTYEKKENNRRKKAIYKCYLERLIYNKIYLEQLFYFPQTSNSEHTQNKEHIERLELTKTDFESCFPSHNIIIDITYIDRYPGILSIKHYKNDIELYSESYHKYIKKTSFGKIIYQSYVDCFMIKNNIKHFKIQSFNSKTVWKKYHKTEKNSLLDERYASLQYSLSDKAQSV